MADNSHTQHLPRRTTSFLGEGFETFHKQRSPEDIDLIEAVKEIYRKVGMHDKIQHMLDSQYLAGCVDRVPQVQRFALNRYFTMVLMSSGVYSEEERYCLLDQGDFNSWLKLFENKVVPYLLQHKLPVTTNGNQTGS